MQVLSCRCLLDIFFNTLAPLALAKKSSYCTKVYNWLRVQLCLQLTGTINALREEVLALTATVNDKDNKITDLKRENEEADSKMQTVRNQLETMRTERNILSKNVSDANEEIEKYKRRLKIMGDQMEQLRDQISKVEGAIAKEHLERQRIETERNTLRSELTLLKKKTLDIEQKLADIETEQIKLVRIIKHADHEKEQMLKEVQRITRERDILGTQVIRRNDELTLLSEKLRILESIMEKGEGAYKARLEDIRVLKLELQVYFVPIVGPHISKTISRLQI